MLKWLKSKISLNLFSYLGWLSTIGILVIVLLINNSQEPIDPNVIGFGLGIGFSILKDIYSIMWILLVIDMFLMFKLKNKFILENKFYNIFWLIGFVVSALITLGFAVLYIADLIIKH